MITKVMKYWITYREGCGEFKSFLDEFWKLQRYTREIENKTISELYLWDQKSYEHNKATGKYLDFKKENGCSDETYVSHLIKNNYPEFASGNFSATLRGAKQRYASAKSQLNKGEISLPTYKSDQPLAIRAAEIRIAQEGKDVLISCPLFSAAYAKEKGYSGSCVLFEVHVHDNTQKTIMDRIIKKVYKLGNCQIIYDRHKLFLMVSYTFEPEIQTGLDANKVLGVDMGIAYAMYASSLGEHERLSIQGAEVIEKAKQIEARRKAMQKQARYCGEGRIGHGTKTRTAPIFNAGEYLANYRDTINNRYSKALIDFAVKYGYGTIQLEELSGIKDTPDWQDADDAYERHRLLQNWTYYDLQQKIEYKAKEVGIEVKKVEARFTSQRCSRCGYIDPLNRQSQAEFKCQQCGFKTNADYNASQNLSIPKIDKIIEKWMKENGANRKRTEKDG